MATRILFAETKACCFDLMYSGRLADYKVYIYLGGRYERISVHVLWAGVDYYEHEIGYNYPHYFI